MSCLETASSRPTPKFRRRHPGGDHELRIQGAEGRVGDMVNGPAQRIGRAVGVAAGKFLVADDNPSLGRNAQDGPVLDLATVAWHFDGTVRPEHAQAQQQAPLGIIDGLGGPAPPVVCVARGARLGVEHWSQAVPGVGSGGGRDPVLIKEAVAHLERAAFQVVQIAGGELERVATLAKSGGLAPEAARRIQPLTRSRHRLGHRPGRKLTRRPTARVPLIAASSYGRGLSGRRAWGVSSR